MEKMGDNTLLYLNFVAERHSVWEKRHAGEPAPWTDDPILRNHKFTNVFRILDYGSQFLLRELILSTESLGDMMMRSFLYRYTNIPEPWEAFRTVHGRYPVQADLEGNLLGTWHEYRDNGGSVFGQAYKMFSGVENKGTDRLTWAVNLTHDYFHPEAQNYIVDKIARLRTLEERVALLRTIPRCGDFMAMQIATDIGWSPMIKGDENEFIVAGPGAKRGIAAARLEGETPADAIALAQRLIHESRGCPTLRLSSGKVYKPSLMDTQNSLCEFGKYYRYLSEGGRGYRPAHVGNLPKVVLPPHWQNQ